jgi:hypothetical protein
MKSRIPGVSGSSSAFSIFNKSNKQPVQKESKIQIDVKSLQQLLRQELTRFAARRIENVDEDEGRALLVIPMKQRLTIALALLQELCTLHDQEKVFIKMRPENMMINLKTNTVEFIRQNGNEKFIASMGEEIDIDDILGKEDAKADVQQMGALLSVLLLGAHDIDNELRLQGLLGFSWNENTLWEIQDLIKGMKSNKLDAGQSYEKLFSIYQSPTLLRRQQSDNSPSEEGVEVDSDVSSSFSKLTL